MQIRKYRCIHVNEMHIMCIYDCRFASKKFSVCISHLFCCCCRHLPLPNTSWSCPICVTTHKQIHIPEAATDVGVCKAPSALLSTE